MSNSNYTNYVMSFNNLSVFRSWHNTHTEVEQMETQSLAISHFISAWNRLSLCFEPESLQTITQSCSCDKRYWSCQVFSYLPCVWECQNREKTILKIMIFGPEKTVYLPVVTVMTDDCHVMSFAACAIWLFPECCIMESPYW